MKVKLTGLTRHGKNRIREHGDEWEILSSPPGVLNMSHMPSTPIRSVKTGDWRWFDDKNFKMEVVDA